jgi:hypothetical protein
VEEKIFWIGMRSEQGQNDAMGCGSKNRGLFRCLNSGLNSGMNSAPDTVAILFLFGNNYPNID